MNNFAANGEDADPEETRERDRLLPHGDESIDPARIGYDSIRSLTRIKSPANTDSMNISQKRPSVVERVQQ